MIKSIVFDFNGVILDIRTNGISEDMIELLKDLYESDFKLYLFSNTSSNTINILDAKYGFLKYFDNVVLAEDHGFSKPSDNSFLELLRVIGNTDEGILYIDDGKDNLRQAEKYGMKAFKFVNVDKLRLNLASLDI